MKNLTLALLPPFDYYKQLSVKADVFTLRLSCQIDNKIKDNYNFTLFEEYIDKYLAQRHNEKAVSESLKHSIGQKGDCSKYKGLSLIDIDHVGIYCGIFLHCYREALAFLSLIDHFNPSKIIISANDPNGDIFDKLAKQTMIEIEIIPSFGNVDKDKKELIRKSNRSLDVCKFDLWHPYCHKPIWEQIITSVFNLWSKLIRLIKGKKPFVHIDCYGHLSGIRAQLSAQKKYYPIFSRLIKLPIINLFLSGFYVLQKQNIPYENKEVSEIIKNYKEHLKIVKNKKTVGQIEFKDKKYSIAGSITHRLYKYAPQAFKQIADSIDIYEDFINKNKVSGALLSSDMNWENRMIVRLFQKHKIENTAHMNGWFAAHTVEYKTADKVLCFGSSHIGSCFKDRDNVKITGSPKFESAYKKRNSIKLKYPIKKILLSTFVFPPNDINGRYGDSEKYLNDVLTVIKKYDEKHNCKTHIAVRPHPSDSPDFYRWYLGRLGFPEIELELAKNFQKIPSHYDLFFASYSSTLFESAAMGVPVIFYHPCNQISYPPFDGSCNELPSAFSLEDLEKIFTRVMKDRDYAYKFTDVKVLKPYVGELDGGTTSRIIKEII